ncbi:MAG: hypothetical protein Q3M24_13270 [Candidatus Electrothrix aestuarii]|uniref:Uncharacterized protein n=1 Tax=Candidatus Electrothrix aestuarii TaxID=3062594 RepID=A0AAU8LPS6_9BACT|nr:hypothetical protein [Candidatus Electrothrix aestuarii]
MNSPQTPLTKGAQSDVPQPYYELMNAMQRVYNVGLYYPIGHNMTERAIGAFVHAVKENVDKRSGYLHFGLTEQSFSLQKRALDTKVPAVKIFHQMFSALHITSLDIHRDINADEARCFFEEIIAHNAKIRTCRDFSQMIITGLPESVKVRQLNSVPDEEDDTDEVPHDTSLPTIEYLLSSLMQRGIPEEMLTICRDLLLSVKEKLAERPLSNAGLASVTWEDVEKLLFDLAEFLQTAAQGEPDYPLEERYNIDALLAIVTALDEPGTDVRSTHEVKKAVNLLVDATKGPVHETQGEELEEKKSLRPRDRTDISVGELKEALLELEEYRAVRPIFQTDRCEQLSVLMVTLGRPLQPQLLIHIQHALTEYFAHVLELDEWYILLQGTRDLFKTLEKDRVRFILVLLTQALRSSPYSSVLIFVRDLCRELAGDELVLFWPFLVNELLVQGAEREPKVFQELCIVAGSLPKQDMRAALPYLKRLDALAERKIADSIFVAHPLALRFLFTLLLESSQVVYFSNRLMKGLQECPFSWLDKAVLPFLDSRSETDQHFLINLFHQENPLYPGQTLRDEGAAIIIERLPLLSAEQKKEQWIAESIAALARTPLLSAYALLVEIAQDRPFLRAGKWPKHARLAALKALKNY